MKRVVLATCAALVGCDRGIVVTVHGRPALSMPRTLTVAADASSAHAEGTLRIPVSAELPLTFVVDTTGLEGDIAIAVDGLDGTRLTGRGATNAAADAAAADITLEPADFVVNRERVVGDQLLTGESTYGSRQLAAGPDGRFLVTWQGDHSAWARTFDERARPQQNAETGTDREFELPTDPINETGVVAAAHTAGSYGLVWQELVHPNGFMQLSIQPYRDDTGAARDRGVIVQGPGVRLPAIAGLAVGAFAVTWIAAADPYTSTGEVQLRVIDPVDPSPPATPVSVGVADRIGTDAPAVAGLVDGGAVVAWSVTDAFDRARIVARVFDGTVARTGQLAIAAPDAGPARLSLPQVTALPDGGFAVAWFADAVGAPAIQARWFDADGAPRGPAVTVAEGVQEHTPAIAASASGVAIAWVDGKDDQRRVRLQRYGLDGTPIGASMAVATTDGLQRTPSLAPLGDQGFIVAWTDGSQQAPDDSMAAVRARVIYTVP
ncbi:MAG: hypothetical protein K8W52_17270 [Deltaproteobacteria bacterium]|nr:hypothetical protein [Deltaproteobacteria bacterium]